MNFPETGMMPEPKKSPRKKASLVQLNYAATDEVPLGRVLGTIWKYFCRLIRELFFFSVLVLVVTAWLPESEVFGPNILKFSSGVMAGFEFCFGIVVGCFQTLANLLF